mgnify:CR=1 FL=1
MVKLPVFQTGALRSSRSIRMCSYKKKKSEMIVLLYNIVMNRLINMKVVLSYVLNIFIHSSAALKLNILYFRIARKLVLGCRNGKSLSYVLCLILVGMNNAPVICTFFLILPAILYFMFLNLGCEIGYSIIMIYFIVILSIDKYARRVLTLLKVSLYFNETLLNFLTESPYPNKIYTRKIICDIKYISKIFLRVRRLK